MLINPHHGSWLHKANKSHGPSFTFGEIRVIGVRGQRLMEGLGPCLWELGHLTKGQILHQIPF